MKGEYRDKKVWAGGKEVFNWSGCSQRELAWDYLRREEEISYGPIPCHDVLRELLDHFKDCRIMVAYEAGPFGSWLHDRLREDGIEVIVGPPSLIPIESGTRSRRTNETVGN